MHFRESCVRCREAADEALTAARAGRALSIVNLVRSAEALLLVEGNTGRPDEGGCPAPGEGRAGSAVSETSRHVRKSDIGTWEASTAPRPQRPGPPKPRQQAKRRMHAGEESDSVIVVMTTANKAAGMLRRSRTSEGPGPRGGCLGSARAGP